MSHGQVSTFSKVFSPTSYDPLTGKYNHKTPNQFARQLSFQYGNRTVTSLDSTLNDYREDIRTKLAAFFGIPNPLRFGIIVGQQDLQIYYKKLTLWKIFKNLAGWEDGKTLGRQIFNGIISPVVFIKNILGVIFFTTKNTAKLLTEYLPGLIADGFDDLGKYCDHRLDKIGFTEKYNEDTEIFSWLALWKIFWHSIHFLSTIGFSLAKSIQILGRTITSPFDSTCAGWYSGTEWGKEFASYFTENETTQKYFSYLTGALLSGTSILFTAGIYTGLMFPFVFGLAPALGIHLSGAASQLSLWFSKTILKEVLTYIGTHIITPFLAELGISVTIKSVTLGTMAMMAASATIVSTAVGTGVWQLVDKAQAKFREEENANQPKSITDYFDEEDYVTTSTSIDKYLEENRIKSTKKRESIKIESGKENNFFANCFSFISCCYSSPPQENNKPDEFIRVRVKSKIFTTNPGLHWNLGSDTVPSQLPRQDSRSIGRIY